jgi:hypothetical protein
MCSVVAVEHPFDSRMASVLHTDAADGSSSRLPPRPQLSPTTMAWIAPPGAPDARGRGMEPPLRRARLERPQPSQPAAALLTSINSPLPGGAAVDKPSSRDAAVQVRMAAVPPPKRHVAVQTTDEPANTSLQTALPPPPPPAAAAPSAVPPTRPLRHASPLSNVTNDDGASAWPRFEAGYVISEADVDVLDTMFVAIDWLITRGRDIQHNAREAEQCKHRQALADQMLYGADAAARKQGLPPVDPAFCRSIRIDFPAELSEGQKKFREAYLKPPAASNAADVPAFTTVIGSTPASRAPNYHHPAYPQLLPAQQHPSSVMPPPPGFEGFSGFSNTSPAMTFVQHGHTPRTESFGYQDAYESAYRQAT